MDNNLLYQNAVYYKEEILPYAFLLETSDGIMVINNTEYDFAHLVGKQYVNDIYIQTLKSQDFFQKALCKEIIYAQMLNEKAKGNYIRYQYIKGKNEAFIDLFNSFKTCNILSIYKPTGVEALREIDMDYFHLKTDKSTSLLGIIGKTNKNSFLFNTILDGTESLYERFINYRKIKVFKLHKIPKSELNDALVLIGKKLLLSDRNDANSSKPKKKGKVDILSNNDFKEINKLLEPTLCVSKGMNGKKSLKITRNGKTVEKGIKLNFKDFKSNMEIAEYINEKYHK